MTHVERTLAVRRAQSADHLDDLIDAAYERGVRVRGGLGLLEQLWGSEISRDQVGDALARCVLAGEVWVALDNEVPVGGALVRDRCVQALWVRPDHRRRRVAATLLENILTSDAAPVDAWALPGDRATKSLYESVGWKARLLTMRAG